MINVCRNKLVALVSYVFERDREKKEERELLISDIKRISEHCRF